jgi:hypothetical protein
MLAVSSVTIAQVAETSGLYKQIMHADRMLFDDGFNHCKMDDLRKRSRAAAANCSAFSIGLR